MNREMSKPWVQKLFDALGPANPKPGKIKIYLDWAERYDEEVVREVIDEVIEYSDDHRLPLPAQLHRMSRTKRRDRKEAVAQEENCFDCGSMGFIPYLYDPVPSSELPFIRNYRCRCTQGDLMSRYILYYFDIFEDLQFRNRIHDFNGMTYPQIVDAVRNEQIREIHSQ